MKRVTTRDPRIDPQPGDEVRDIGIIRRVVRREGEKLLIQGLRTYWMRVDTWQKWCEQSGAEAVSSGKSRRE